MLRGLVTAFRTLSALPVPGMDTDKMTRSLPWFPLVGFTLGAIVFWIAIGASRLAITPWHEGTAVLLLAAGALLTRGIHLDGLADWADGFFCTGDREKVLRVMKDPHIGVFGVVAIVVVLLAKWAALARLLAGDSPRWIIAACIVSRTAMVDLAVSQPYARPEGGTGAGFIGAAGWKHLLAAVAAAALLLAASCGPGLRWAAALLTGLLVSRLFGIYCRRRAGGVTGDLLGADCEIVETIVLAAGATLT